MTSSPFQGERDEVFEYMVASPKFFLGSFLRAESSDFLEWLAYHRAVGASHVHIFTDHKTLRKSPLFDALAKADAITLHPVRTDGHPAEEDRNSALRFAALEAGESGGYGLYLPRGEYFRINSTAKTVQSLMRTCGGADVLSAPVHVFGSAGLVDHIPGPVLHTATGRAPLPADTAVNVELRSVVRLGRFGLRTPEVPTGPASGEKIKWVSGDGSPMPEPLSRLAWSGMPTAFGTTKAAVLKLPAPSVEAFLLRMADQPEKQRPDAEALAAQLDALAAMTEADPGLSDWSDAIALETEALLALPGVADAQAALCTREAKRLDDLRGEASDLGRLLAAIRGDAPPEEKSAEPVPAANLEATPPPAKEPETGPDSTIDLPAWFAEIHTSGDNEGFYTRLKNHAVMCVRRDDARLVVTFDNLSNVNNLSPKREPWAYKFVRDNGCSHLSVMARRKDWYRDPQLIAYLEKLAADGFFGQFGKVFLTGTSMGGFAALTFSSLAPGATVISFNPQTTLDESIVPWEERFGFGRQRDWSLPYSDCAFEIDEIENAFVFYDPFFTPDRRHAERLEGDNVFLLKTWCSGHFSPVFLRKANLLKPVMQHALDGTLTPKVFYKMFRERRSLPWYRKAMESNLAERGHPALAERVKPAFRKLKRQAAE